MYQLPGRNYKLSKDELLRGHDSFRKVFRLSRVIESDFLRFNYILPNIEEGPQHTCKVGFSVSKKYLKKAVSRNRLKRILREIYRLNKNKENSLTLTKLSYLIISVKEKHLRDDTFLIKHGYNILNTDYQVLIGKMNNKISVL